MLNILKKIFKHRHKWRNTMSCSPFDGLYEEGWDYWYRCKCGAIKRKYMTREEEIIESKGE